MPCFFIDNGIMGILKDDKFIGSGFSSLLGLEVLADGLAQHGMPHVFLLFKNVGNCGTVPTIGVMVAVVSALPMLGLFQIGRRYQHLFLGQLICNRLCPHAVNNHLEYPADYLCSFFVNQQMVFVLRVTLIAIRDSTTASFSVLHP